MSEDALTWLPPTIRVPPIPEVSFGEIRFDGDPARPVGLAELRRQAGAIGRRVTEPALARECGLVPPSDPRFSRNRYTRPVVTSVRSARRVGPDGQVTFDTVAEVVQTRWVEASGRLFEFYGGATLIIGARGDIRYIIRKRVDHPDRPEEQAAYAAGAGAQFWRAEGRSLTPRPDSLRGMCFVGRLG